MNCRLDGKKSPCFELELNWNGNWWFFSFFHRVAFIFKLSEIWWSTCIYGSICDSVVSGITLKLNIFLCIFPNSHYSPMNQSCQFIRICLFWEKMSGSGSNNAESLFFSPDSPKTGFVQNENRDLASYRENTASFRCALDGVLWKW